jgi:regulator of protease activity HflC (stomatin/prohibitin superfamily)
MSTSSDLKSAIHFPEGMFGGRPGGGGGGVIRLVAVALALGLVVMLSSNLFTYINPGHVGIVIHRMGGGVDKTPMGPGVHFRNPLVTAIEEYPTFMQTLVLTRGADEGSLNNDEINVNSIEGQPVSLDVSMSFELNPARVPALYTTFRSDISTIQHTYVKQAIRQALQEVVGSEETANIIGPKKAQVVSHTQRLLEQRLAPYGIEVKQFTINELRAPQSVIDAINAKNVMQQQALTAQNELQKKMFQAQGDSIQAAGHAKAITAEAEAQSKANTLLSQSITGSLVQYEMVKRWDGKMPQVSGGTPMLQLPMPAR